MRVFGFNTLLYNVVLTLRIYLKLHINASKSYKNLYSFPFLTRCVNDCSAINTIANLNTGQREVQYGG